MKTARQECPIIEEKFVTERIQIVKGMETGNWHKPEKVNVKNILSKRQQKYSDFYMDSTFKTLDEICEEMKPGAK